MCVGRKFGVRWCVAKRCKFGNETAQRGKIQWHGKASAANSVWRVFVGKTTHGKFSLASVAKWAVLVGKTSKAKMERCLGGGLLSLSLSLSLSLVARTFWHTFGLNLKGFFTHFIVNFSYFIVVLTHLFAYKRHFLGHCAFLKFLNALFMRFYALFVILSVAKNPKNLRYALFMDTSLTLSMTARQKFKFFIQNSRHFINSTHFVNSKHFTNSTHFITLSQISSPTQGFFIFLPQVFAQCKLIKNFLQGGHYV